MKLFGPKQLQQCAGNELRFIIYSAQEFECGVWDIAAKNSPGSGQALFHDPTTQHPLLAITCNPNKKV